MNIFALHTDPYKSAEMHCDKHVVKMILETCQLLSTAHRVLDGEQVIGKTKTGRNVKRWVLPDSRDETLYQATHVRNRGYKKWQRRLNRLKSL